MKKRIEQALDFAKEVHKGQKYGKQDYFEYHVMGVGRIVKHEYFDLMAPSAYSVWGISNVANAVYIGSILHDTMEDGKNPQEISKYIKENFGSLVLEMVIDLTRKEGESYRKYIERLIESPNMGSKIIKKADLYFNRGHSKGARFDKYDLALSILSQC